MVEGRVVRVASSPARVLFRTGPGQLLAVGERGAPGALPWRRRSARHRINVSDGTTVLLDVRTGGPTVVTRGDGVPVGALLHGTSMTAYAEPGGTVCHVVRCAAEPGTEDTARLSILDPGGHEFGRIEVVRTPAGWARGRTVDEAGHTYVWWDRGGSALDVPVLGTRLVINRDLDRVEREILLAVCTEIAVDPRSFGWVLSDG